MSTYILEIGTEEIPARFIANLLDQIHRKVRTLLNDHGIADSRLQTLGTYRRLVLKIQGLPTQSNAKLSVVHGPPLAIAKDDKGNWAGPAIGFAKKVGLSPNDLATETVNGRDILVANKEEPGLDMVDFLSQQLPPIIANLDLPIAMRWAGHKETFIRPIHWILSLLESQVVPLSMFDIDAGKQSYGHRFLSKNPVDIASGQPLTIPSASVYEAMLKDAFVMVDPAARRQIMSKYLKEKKAMADETLLDEVVHLLEWPTPLQGQFDERFLSLPAPVLIQCMRKHQKYFSAKDGKGLRNTFFFMADSVTPDNKNTIIKGNEKVLRARLSDMDFFWKEDKKKPLSDRVEALKRVVYQQGLGTLFDKKERVKGLALYLAEVTGTEIPKADIERAADLAKADLVTAMVIELTDLQGTMGRIYAEQDGEKAEVARSIEEHYWPKHTEAALPDKGLPALLAMADRIDSIAACYVNNLLPSGSQDPWGIRRAMLALFQIIRAYRLPINLSDAFDEAYKQLNKGRQNRDKLDAFFQQRLRIFLNKSLPYDCIDAVLANILDNVVVATDTATALNQWRLDAPEEFKQLVESSIRIKRLAQKSDTAGVASSLFEDQAEQGLYQSIQQIEGKIDEAISRQDVAPLWTDMQTLIPSITHFFDKVLVMADNQDLRNNRLALLRRCHNNFAKLADFEKIVIDA